MIICLLKLRTVVTALIVSSHINSFYYVDATGGCPSVLTIEYIECCTLYAGMQVRLIITVIKAFRMMKERQLLVD